MTGERGRRVFQVDNVVDVKVKLPIRNSGPSQRKTKTSMAIFELGHLQFSALARQGSIYKASSEYYLALLTYSLLYYLGTYLDT